LHDIAHGINPAIKKKAERCAEIFDYLAQEYLERHAKSKKREALEAWAKRLQILVSGMREVKTETPRA